MRSASVIPDAVGRLSILRKGRRFNDCWRPHRGLTALAQVKTQNREVRNGSPGMSNWASPAEAGGFTWINYDSVSRGRVRGGACEYEVSTVGAFPTIAARADIKTVRASRHGLQPSLESVIGIAPSVVFLSPSCPSRSMWGAATPRHRSGACRGARRGRHAPGGAHDARE